MKHVVWNPVDGLEGEFWLVSVYDDADDLTLTFRPENSERHLKIVFPVPLSYQKTCSGDFVKSAGPGSFRGVFLQIEESPYLKWFLEESSENWINKDVVHYAFRTINFHIDVLAAHPPIVEWVD